MARGSRLARLAALGLLGVADPHRVRRAGQRVLAVRLARRHHRPGARTCAELWTGSVIAALIVGFLVWGLILYSVVRAPEARRRAAPADGVQPAAGDRLHDPPVPHHRRRCSSSPCVVQDKVQERSDNPDETIAVNAFKWNWQFVYPDTKGPTASRSTRSGTSDRDPDPRAPDRPDDPLRARLGRRHPLLLGAGVPLQARRHPGQRERPEQRLPGDRPQGGRLRRPLRRAVRHLPRVHELRGPRGVRRRLRRLPRRPASRGMSTADALEKIGQPGRRDDHPPARPAADTAAQRGQTPVAELAAARTPTARRTRRHGREGRVAHLQHHRGLLRRRRPSSTASGRRSRSARRRSSCPAA